VITLPDATPFQPSLASPDRLLLSVARRQRRSLLGAAGTGTLWMLSQSAVPVVVGRTLDAGVVRGDRTALAIGAGLLAGLALVAALTGMLRHRLAVSNWMQANLRMQQLIGHHVADEGLAVSASMSTGEVVQTAGTDTSRIGDLFDVAARAAGAVLCYLAITVLLLRIDLSVGSWVAIGVPALSGFTALIIRPLRGRQLAYREREGELTALGADTVAGLRVLRGIGGEQLFLERYREHSQQVRRAGVRVSGLEAALAAAQVLLPGVFIVVLTWLGAHAVLEHRLTVGELLTLYGYAAFLRLPLETATETLSRWIVARVAAARVIAILRLRQREPRPWNGTSTAGPLDSQLPPGAVAHDPESGFTLAAGELTGLVTDRPEQALALCGRLSAVSGRDRGQGPGAPRILLTEAEPRLFTGSLRAELDPYARHPDLAIRRALDVADAADVLAALPEGLDTEVEERGRQFSGGQRQRLVLARAVLADPEVLLLLDPTSAVDAHTEARVGQRLRAARRGRTTLVSTASPLLLDLCDRVVYMSGEHVTAVGRHRELLRDCLPYRRTVSRTEADAGVDAGVEAEVRVGVAEAGAGVRTGAKERAR
jgi:ABC-type multidrug transport system fused ATPase/permease subunit